MIVVVDLHAAEIDQRLALASGIFERRQGLATAPGEYCFSFYIQGVGLQAALVSGLGQADGIEDAGWHAVAIGGAQDLGFAGVGGGVRNTGSEAR